MKTGAAVPGPLTSHHEGGLGCCQPQEILGTPAGMSMQPWPPLNKSPEAEPAGPMVVMGRLTHMDAPRPGCQEDTKTLGKLKGSRPCEQSGGKPGVLGATQREGKL